MRFSSARVVVCLATALVLFKSGDAIKCSVCDTSGGDASCLTRPPPPQPCEESFASCIEVTKYQKNGRLHAYTRSCSPFSLPESCMGGVDKASGAPLQICYSTCARDGCNGSTSLHHVLELLRRRRRGAAAAGREKRDASP